MLFFKGEFSDPSEEVRRILANKHQVSEEPVTVENESRTSSSSTPERRTRTDSILQFQRLQQRSRVPLLAGKVWDHDPFNIEPCNYYYSYKRLVELLSTVDVTVVFCMRIPVFSVFF